MPADLHRVWSAVSVRLEDIPEIVQTSFRYIDRRDGLIRQQISWCIGLQWRIAKGLNNQNTLIVDLSQGVYNAWEVYVATSQHSAIIFAHMNMSEIGSCGDDSFGSTFFFNVGVESIDCDSDTRVVYRSAELARIRNGS